MNFFSVGFILCSIKFSLDIPLTYVIKLIGMGFMLGGYKEIEPIFESFGRFKAMTSAAALCTAGGLVCACLNSFGVTKGALANLLSIIFGSLSVVLIIINQRSLIEHMYDIQRDTEQKDITNDPSLVRALKNAWQKAAFFTLLSLASDIAYRLIPDGAIRTAAGTVQVISMLLMYIYIISMGTAFGRVRNDFNITHPL